MGTFQRLKDSLGFDNALNNLKSNNQEGIDSISEVYDALYALNVASEAKITEHDGQIDQLITLTNNSTSQPAALDGSVIGGYLLNSNTQRPYKLTVGQVQSSSVTGTINGESIYGHKFYCQPGSIINEIAFRIMTAGASGMGLAQCRVLIYRTKLNSAGNIIIGDLELDTNINISTLTTGLKVISNLNHTLSSNTYKDCWFICIRNYQSGSLSLKLHSNTGTVSWYADLSQSSTTYARDMGWYFSCPYNIPTPVSGPAVSAATPSTTAVAEHGQYIMFGYSAT
jgi:hypothetical protein